MAIYDAKSRRGAESTSRRAFVTIFLQMAITQNFRAISIIFIDTTYNK